MKQRSVSRRRSGKLRRLWMQERLYILCDDYLHETGCSFQSLTTGTNVLRSGDEHLHMVHDSVGNCMHFGLTMKGEKTCTIRSGMLCAEVRLETLKMERSQVKPQGMLCVEVRLETLKMERSQVKPQGMLCVEVRLETLKMERSQVRPQELGNRWTPPLCLLLHCFRWTVHCSTKSPTSVLCRRDCCRS
jgi:hypothetical protein